METKHIIEETLGHVLILYGEWLTKGHLGSKEFNFGAFVKARLSVTGMCGAKHILDTF